MTDLVPARECATRADADQHALVLAAVGIKVTTAVEDGGFVLLVSPEEEARARENLAAYDEEESQRVRRRRRLRPFVPRVEAPLAFCAVMAFFYSASMQDAFGVHWFLDGAANAGLVADGQWWRTVTALCLHANFGHLVGNLLAGSVVGLLLALTVGSGVTWLAVLLTGALGNEINAVIHPAAHTSIGASTAIFSGLGLMAGFTQVSETAPWHRGVRRWAPIAAGIALLVLMGTAGENTDVWAHVAGFFVGGLVGLALGRAGADLAGRRLLQALCGAAALLVLAGAWGLAILGA
ncbi:MAG: rhomboid family intramembrane serine protease [Alphaproteobacteria bacterium]|nr:rhomboid family intramembrane serine protease [Alphaproteobacteria bacterium]